LGSDKRKAGTYIETIQVNTVGITENERRDILLYKKEKGAVTIFCIIVLFSIILLGGLFIDASRVLLAKQIVRSSMNSAARSALSYYDTGMVGDFGLYGVSEADAKEQFERYFVNNLTLSKNDGFNLYEFEMGDNPVTVSVSEPLSDNDVFINQASEYSKYRAGIDLTIGVVEKVKMLFGDNGAGNKVFGSIDDSKKAYTDLKKNAANFGRSVSALMKSGIDTAAKKAKQDVLQAIKDGTVDTLEDYGLSALNTELESIKTEISNMKQDKAEYDTASENANKNMNDASLSEVEYYDEASSSWQKESPGLNTVQNEEEPADSPNNQANAIISAAESESQALQNRINTNLASIKAKAQQAQNLSKETEQLTADIESLNEEIEKVKKSEDVKTQQKGWISEEIKLVEYLMEKLSTTDTKLYDELSEYRKNLDNSPSESKLNDIHKRIEEIDTELKLSEQDEEYKEKKSSADTAKQNYLSVQTSKSSKLKSLEEQKKNKENEKSSKENQINTLKNEISSLYDDMASDNEISGEIDYEMDVSESDEILDKEFNNVWNQLTDKLAGVPKELAKRADSISAEGSSEMTKPEQSETGWALIEDIQSTFEGLVEICTDPTTLLERAYLVEYGMDKFTFLTSNSSRPSHHFQLGEVEYILEGNNIQCVNLASVFGKIFTLRLAIDFVDDIIHTQSPEPLSRALIALGRALIDASYDMYDLIFTDEGCRLCPSFSKVKLSYSDHIRLMLMLDTVKNKNQIVDRMQTMVDRTMDVKETNRTDALYTRITATSEVKINLIMLTLPMFGKVMAGQDIIKDGKFTIRETVSMGY
jgi:hypothetical protein